MRPRRVWRVSRWPRSRCWRSRSRTRPLLLLPKLRNDPPERRGTPVHFPAPPQPMDALRPSIKTGEVPGQTAPGANGVGGGLSGNVVEGNLPGRFAPDLPANGQGTQPISSPMLSVLTQASTSPAEVPEPSKDSLAGATKSLLREAKAPALAAESEGNAATVGKPAEAGRLDETASSVARQSMASLPMLEKPVTDTASPTLAQAQNDPPERRGTPVHFPAPPQPMDALPPSLQTEDLRGQTASGATKQATQPSSSPVASELTEPSTSPAGVREPSRGPLAGGTNSPLREAKAPVVAAEAEGEAAAVGKPAEVGRLDETASSVVPQSAASLPMWEKSDADTPSPTLAPPQSDGPERRETPVYASVPPRPMDALAPSLQTDDVPGQAAPGADGVAGGSSGDVVEGSTAGTFAPCLPAKGQGAQPISSPVLSVLTQPSTSPAEVPEPPKGPLPAGTKSLLREARAPVVAAEGEGEAAASKPPEAGQLDDTTSSVAPGSMASLPMPENQGPGNSQGGMIASSNEHGMPVALQDGRMQAKPEVNEISAPAEQNLPTQGAAAESPRRTGMSNKAELAAADKALEPLSSAEPAAAVLSNHSSGAGLAGRAETPMPQAAAGQPPHRAIENVLTGLPRIGAGSTSVVLNPDGNTQLVLHVKFEQGCSRGSGRA